MLNNQFTDFVPLELNFSKHLRNSQKVIKIADKLGFNGINILSCRGMDRSRTKEIKEKLIFDKLNHILLNDLNLIDLKGNG